MDKGPLKDIDYMLRGQMTPLIAAFEMPPGLMVGTDPKNKWRVISCLQKAIRFGDVEMAQHMMSVAIDLDPFHAIKRLGVIAVEDVGFGNLGAVMQTLAALGDAKWRLGLGGKKVMVWLATQLAQGFKDRSACELLVSVELWENDLKVMMGGWTNEKLDAVIDDESNDWRTRFAAIWNMAGTKRYPGTGMSESNDRPATPLFRKMVQNGMSLAGYYVAAKAASRLQDSMFPALYIMDEWARHADKVKVTEFETPKALVGKLLGAAYDQYVREGKVAIAKLFRETPQLQQFLIASPEERRGRMQMSGVFLAEGGTLNKVLAYGGSTWVRNQVRVDETRFHWLPDGLRGTYLDAVRQNLDALNVARAKVLYATLKS